MAGPAQPVLVPMLEIRNGIMFNFYLGLPCTCVEFVFTFLPHLDTQTLKVAVAVALVLLAVVLAIAVASAVICRQVQRYVCLMTPRHRRLQTCVGTRARLDYSAFDAQLQKACFVTTQYAIHMSVRA